MSGLDELGQTRRKLTALLAGTSWAGLLHAAPGPALAPSTAASPAPTDGGGDFTGRWVHAFAAYGAPKYGPDFTHFEYVNPGAPKGGTL